MRFGWKDGRAVSNYVARIRPKVVAKMFDEHFSQHPITIFEKPNNASTARFRNLPISIWNWSIPDGILSPSPDE